MRFLTIFYLLNPKIFLKYWLGKVYFYHTTNKSINVPLMVLKSEDFFKVLQVLHRILDTHLNNLEKNEVNYEQKR